tara:strand:- start:68518 stop:69693 length:1176 start_codon:yes stop_codon:yes gene_type:complete
MNNEVVIVSAVRTPLGCFMGSLSSFSAVELGIKAVNGALERIKLDKNLIDELIIGHVLQAGCGQAPAKQIAVGCNLKPETPCTSINKVCSSGLKSISIAAQSIQLGHNDIVIAGGIESMSNCPHYINLRKPKKIGNLSSTDGMLLDGLTDVYSNESMGVLADKCAEEFQISRSEQDQYAKDSYKKTVYNSENNFFKNEIIPIEYIDKKGNKIFIEKDEQPGKVKYEKISTLNPAFTKNGTVTAANSSPISDGASIVILMSKTKAKELGINPLATIIGYKDSSNKPEWFTTAPAKGIKELLNKTSTDINEIDLFEINEAFSVVSLVNTKILSLDKNKVNINGGAVSLGHPLGCSGARILTTLIHSLHKNNLSTGVASICNGGGGSSSIQIKI